MNLFELTPIGLWRELTNPAQGRRKALKVFAAGIATVATYPVLVACGGEPSVQPTLASDQGSGVGGATPGGEIIPRPSQAPLAPTETAAVTPTASALHEGACGYKIVVTEADNSEVQLKWQDFSEVYSHHYGKLKYNFTLTKPDAPNENNQFEVTVQDETGAEVDGHYELEITGFGGGILMAFHIYDGALTQGSIFIANCFDGTVFVSPTLEEREYSPYPEGFNAAAYSSGIKFSQL